MKPLRLFTVRRSLFAVYCSLITALFLAHTLFYYFALGTDAVDDAYISFRYAQNAIRGHGLFFNPGERVEGFTNFLWTALMLPLEGAHVDVGRASMLLGVLFALATLWLVMRFAKSVGAPRGVGWLAALLLAVDGSFALWAVGGLETPLFAFLIFAGALLYVREQASDKWQVTGDKARLTSHVSRFTSLVTRHFPLSGIFFALAAMTRPEGAMIFALTVAHQAAWRLLTEHRLCTFRDLSRIFAFAALFAPYWLGRWWYYKSFLPNSFHAKVSASGPTAQIERGWNHLAQFMQVHLGWLITLPPVAGVARDMWQVTRDAAIVSRVTCHVSRAFWTTYFAALIIPYGAYIVYVGGDWSVGRFFVPLLAPFYLLFATGVVEVWQWLVDRFFVRESQRDLQSQRMDANKISANSRYSRILSLALAALIFVSSSWFGEYGIYIRGFDAAKATEARVTMGKWLHTHVPRGTFIAVDAAGQVPYFSELPAIDMFGINDLHIGRLQVATLGQGTPGHEKFDLVYVITRAPEYVIIYGTALDDMKEYERAPIEWTNDVTLYKFLTLYRRKR